MKVKGILCKKCGTGLYSRALNDYRECPCGSGVAIDGGRDYMKISFVGDGDYEIVDFEVEGLSRDADLESLFREDWLSGRDEYGLVRKDVV